MENALLSSSGSVTGVAVPGGWSERKLVLAGRTFDLALPAEPDALLEHLASLPVEEHDRHDVYWAQLWQAAPPTAERVLKATWRSGQSALEFGCGLGLVGVAGLMAGLDVTFSDYEPLAVRTALENARRNGFPAARGELLDWRSPPKSQYQVLLGCDVLYNLQMHEPLANFIDAVLASDGLCWIGDAGRFHAGNFWRVMRERGFDVHLEGERGDRLHETRHGKFQLFVIRRRS
jgi:predicted nicotinamide N-methyase